MSERLTTQSFSDREAAGWWQVFSGRLTLEAIRERTLNSEEMPREIKIYKILIQEGALAGASSTYESAAGAKLYAAESGWLNPDAQNDVVLVEVTVKAPGVIDKEKITEVLVGSDGPFLEWISQRNARRRATNSAQISE